MIQSDIVMFIGVRRFIRALESDGQTCEMKHRQRFQKMRFAASHNLSGRFCALVSIWVVDLHIVFVMWVCNVHVS